MPPWGCLWSDQDTILNALSVLKSALTTLAIVVAASVPPLKVNHIQHSVARNIAAEVLAIEKELIVAISVGVVRDVRCHDDTWHVPQFEVALRQVISPKSRDAP